MVCKKCGKEFNSENNVCPFCNEDNTVAETPVAAPETPKEETPAAPVETPSTPEVVPAETPATPQPEAPEVKEEPEIENLFDEPKKEEPEKEELVIEEPKVTSETPTETTAAEAVPAAPVAETMPEVVTEAATTPEETSTEAPVEQSALPETTPVAENTPTTETPAATEETTPDATKEEPAPKKNNAKKLIFLIIIALLVAVVVYMYLPKGDDGETATNEPSTNQTTNQNNNNNNNTGNQNNNNGSVIKPETTKINDLLAYSGTYTNGDIEIYLYTVTQFEVKYVYFMVYNTADSVMSGHFLELNKNGTLVYDDASFGEETKINVEKTSDGIKVSASSTDSESILNNITNTYVKKEFQNYNWAGLYQNDKTELVLDIFGEQSMSIYGNSESGVFSYSLQSNVNITNAIITYERELLDEKETITIEKTVDGISITATSTDPEEDLSYLNGTFKKIN